jgi:membrane-bound metal-dependent hydrolase YbcI (DUF457 family)
MWPWGHLAVGYLLYRVFVRVRGGRAPGGPATLAVAFGTQFPDLIDKPLAWWLGVLPSGRTLAHSVLTALIVSALLYALARRRNATDLAVAFAVGYLSHPLADAFLPLFQGHAEYVAYLLWPLLGLPFYRTEATVLASVGSFDLTVYGLIQLGLALLAVVVWLLDGAPGLAELGRLFGVGEERDPAPDR